MLLVAVFLDKAQGQGEQQRWPIPTIDGLIAATGLAYDMVVITRSIKDMDVSRVALLNPWVE